MVPGSAATIASGNEGLHEPVRLAYARALAHLRSVQHADGRVAGEVVWNPMLVSQYVMLRHILGRPIDGPRRARIRRSLECQVCDDGGWGMHPDSPSYLFHTVLGYVALRLLGYDGDDPLVAGARRWIAEHGGPYGLPQWGRIWLAMLGLYPWSGVHPIAPELWLLPQSAPLHPRRFYCHMRLIYLGLSFLYGHAFVHPSDARIAEIRSELFPEGDDPKRFAATRDDIAPTDLFEAPGAGLSAAFSLLRRVQTVTPAFVRRKALAKALEHINFELSSTNNVCLSPVNGLLFTLALFITDRNHPNLQAALDGIEYWVWEDEDEGMRICGARSDIWDTSFLIQALTEGPRCETSDTIVRDACHWLPKAQLREELPGGPRHFRAPTTGGWGFANEDHPWPVSDCTAEALEALLRAEVAGVSDSAGQLSRTDKLAAIEFVLLRQNDDGGFGSYESRRGSMALRRYNPAEIYGNCMLEYSYTECSGSCVRALAYALRVMGDQVPGELRQRTQAAVDRGVAFIGEREQPGGGWLGFWGINVTYGTLFASAGLVAAGVGTAAPQNTRAAKVLVGMQRRDGGWGEDWRGMVDETAVPLPKEARSLVVQTAWALLTLMEVAPHERLTIDRGIRFLVARQSTSGAWPSEPATGVFFNTAMLEYRLYRQIFPAWALARWQAKYQR
ncbi:MAG: hypothetical protein JKY37_34645 [Nannocystaceae bacterium]|nr:hypothetical protein [Nannocystaceae bacterium]